MQSLAYIPASNGAANASLMTVQNVRSPGASDIIVNTTTGAPNKFYASMGAPHTFVDPVTGETITVISEATAVDFAGHLDSGKVVIDAIAPGYTDSRGSLVGDVVVIRPVTEWANNLFNVLSVAHNDDGTLKAVTSNPGWTDITGTTITSVTHNGNRSYDLAVSSDLRGIISPGFRFRTTRGTPVPTQAASLDGATQYFTKSSPSASLSGITGSFTIMGWIKPSAYPASTQGAIWTMTSGGVGGAADRGMGMRLMTTGQIDAFYGNAGYVTANTYPSVDPNRWTHVAVVCVPSTKTYTFYFDGEAVPATAVTGTATSVNNASNNMYIGAANFGSAAQFFPGKLDQIGVFNAALSAATIKAHMNQGLTGTETNNVGAWSLSNSLTDLNTTAANNLTASGAATTTNADAPWGGQAGGTIDANKDYAIVEKVTAGVVTVQAAEGCTIPTTGTLTASYSPLGIPYGFPREKAKWTVSATYVAAIIKLTTVANTAYNIVNQTLRLPVGKWDVGIEGQLYYWASAANTGLVMTGLTPTNTGAGTLNTPAWINPAAAQVNYITATGAGTTGNIERQSYSAPYDAPSAVNLFPAIWTQNAISEVQWYPSGGSMCLKIYAENAYL